MNTIVLEVERETSAPMECLPCLVTALLICAGFWGGVAYLIWRGFHG